MNLACAEGHPASVMDMSFANQALAAEYLFKHASELEDKVYDVPAAIDDDVARVKLRRSASRSTPSPRSRSPI